MNSLSIRNFFESFVFYTYKLQKAIIQRIFRIIKKIMNSKFFNQNEYILLVGNGYEFQINEIINRCSYYVKGKNVKLINLPQSKFLHLKYALNMNPILHFSDSKPKPYWLYESRGGVFNIDYLNYYYDGWSWHELLNYISAPEKSLVVKAKERLVDKIRTIENYNFKRCYIFGTGPSLELAINYDWSDGIRIVCNTIVKDSSLWNHIDPHFIVAGDAIYHFGHTAFAKKFREDLYQRIKTSGTSFVYPIIFHPIVSREFGVFKDKLIPIPQGNFQSLNLNLLNNFSLPALGNVLNLLLLPLSCTLSKNIFLFGFDGRGPDDELFWRNSNKHTYIELMESLKVSHPAFFNYFLSKEDPLKYVKSVHGDLLDRNLNAAEAKGWKFVMMHHTWTPTLQKRFPIN